MTNKIIITILVVILGVSMGGIWFKSSNFGDATATQFNFSGKELIIDTSNIKDFDIDYGITTTNKSDQIVISVLFSNDKINWVRRTTTTATSTDEINDDLILQRTTNSPENVSANISAKTQIKDIDYKYMRLRFSISPQANVIGKAIVSKDR